MFVCFVKKKNPDCSQKNYKNRIIYAYIFGGTFLAVKRGKEKAHSILTSAASARFPSSSSSRTNAQNECKPPHFSLKKTATSCLKKNTPRCCSSSCCCRGSSSALDYLLSCECVSLSFLPSFPPSCLLASPPPSQVLIGGSVRPTRATHRTAPALLQASNVCFYASSF